MRKTLSIVLVSAAVMTATTFVRSDSPTRPTTQPTSGASGQGDSPEKLLDQMLKTPPSAPKPLAPTLDAPAPDKTGGRGAVAPNVPVSSLQREGTFIFDRVGRLTRSADGSRAEFTFDSDGKTLKDPPVVILPNLKLMTMEDAVKSTNRDLKFRVTGMLTEYRGRNYLLLEKVLVPPEANQQF